jgi:organic radical activating enzyme
MLAVSEQFYSLQGEGPTVGTPALFLRLKGCNLLCEGKWRCDTIEVWKKGKNWSEDDILQHWQDSGWLDRLSEGAHLVVTGGEPLLQQKALEKFLRRDWFVEVETNGTIVPAPGFAEKISQFNVSPKLKNSGAKKMVPEALAWHAKNQNSIFKFVICDEGDFEEIESDFLAPYNVPKRKVFLMPAAESRSELRAKMGMVSALAISKGVGVSNRLHLELWDRKTGV